MVESSIDAATEKKMAALIESAPGIRLAILATNHGRAALCGVDELLQKELGEDYRRENNGTWWAGFYVACMMREMGYLDGPPRKCPKGCVAGSGITFKPPPAAVS
jgi:hypothetical protein